MLPHIELMLIGRISKTYGMHLLIRQSFDYYLNVKRRYSGRELHPKAIAMYGC